MSLSAATVHDRLQSAARSLRWTNCLRQGLVGGVAAALFFVIFLVLDVAFHLGSFGRWAGFILIIASLLWAIGAAVLAALQPISEAGIARRIESSCANSGNVLISAVQFDRTLPIESPMRAMLFKEMRDPFPHVDWKQVFDLRLLQKLAMAAGVIIALLALWAVIRPAYLANAAARVLMPSRQIDPLTRTHIAEILPGNVQAVRGKPITIRARLEGEIPKVAWIQMREEGSSWQRVTMEHETGSDEFTLAVPVAGQPIEYRLEAGDALSNYFKLGLRPRTAIATKSARIEFPAYMHLPAQVLTSFTSLQNIPAGSKVILSLHFNAPVRALNATSGAQDTIEAKANAPTDWEATFSPTANGKLDLAYTDADTVADSESFTYTVRADEPPKLTIETPPEGKELLMSPENDLRIRFVATDAIGLGTVTLYRSTADSQTAEALQSWKDLAGKTSFTTEVSVPLSKYKKESQVNFCIEAKDQNDVTGPGVAISRPIVVTLKAAEEVQKQAAQNAAQNASDLRALIDLQQTNLQQTLTISQSGGGIPPLAERQEKIQRAAEHLAAALDQISPQTRSDLTALLQAEMPQAVTTLRDASTAETARQAAFLSQATQLETMILMKLKGANAALDHENAQTKIADLIAGLEDLLRRQHDIEHDTSVAARDDFPRLADREDALSEAAVSVRKSFDAGAKDATLGDQDFRDNLATVATQFGTFRIYEDMLTAAERLQAAQGPSAREAEQRVLQNLSKMLDLLNKWRLAAAAKSAEDLKQAAKDLAAKLAKLEDVQKEIVEKSQELARKGDARPEDQATADKIKELKAPMAQAIEQMLTDAHIFPDLKACNELRSELTQIHEDVIQADKEDVANGTLEAKEVAVQKSESLLAQLAKAEALTADMEMYLPAATDTAQWHLENFDKTEMPEVGLPPLPEAFEDLVGDLLDEQQSIADQVQDSSSNQLLSQNKANGWAVKDGPMGSFGAQGKSGNEKPNHNEQSGRSSGGRTGETTGEMVGDVASNLEGDKPDARRTSDPFQQGHVQDNDGINHNAATGGGKAGGLSDQAGMDGNAPLRPAQAPRMEATDALAVEQALLAEKTAKTSASASLLYLKGNRLSDAADLMRQSQQALKDGRMMDFQSLHRRVLESLHEVQGDLHGQSVVAMPVSPSAAPSDNSSVSGDEGQVPARYRDAVADYYRSLVEGK